MQMCAGFPGLKGLYGLHGLKGQKGISGTPGILPYFKCSQKQNKKMFSLYTYYY